MPTKHPRHAITETPRLKVILDRLRDESGQIRLDWGELVALGAKEKLKRLRQGEDDLVALRKEAADQVRTGSGDLDVAAADEVKSSGWISR